MLREELAQFNILVSRRLFSASFLYEHNSEQEDITRAVTFEKSNPRKFYLTISRSTITAKRCISLPFYARSFDKFAIHTRHNLWAKTTIMLELGLYTVPFRRFIYAFEETTISLFSNREWCPIKPSQSPIFRLPSSSPSSRNNFSSVLAIVARCSTPCRPPPALRSHCWITCEKENIAQWTKVLCSASFTAK